MDFFQCFVGKNGAVFTYVEVAGVATAALADAAFHPVFQGCVDLLIGKIQLFQVLQHEFNHYGRPAGYGNGIVGRGVDFHEE